MGTETANGRACAHRKRSPTHMKACPLVCRCNCPPSLLAFLTPFSSSYPSVKPGRPAQRPPPSGAYSNHLKFKSSLLLLLFFLCSSLHSTNPSSGLPCAAAREQGISFPLVDKPGPCHVHLTQTLRYIEQIVADTAAVPTPHPPLLTQLQGGAAWGILLKNKTQWLQVVSFTCSKERGQRFKSKALSPRREAKPLLMQPVWSITC